MKISHFRNTKNVVGSGIKFCVWGDGVGLLNKLELRMVRLKRCLDLTNKHSEEEAYYEGRIDELKFLINMVVKILINR